jgi:hypothetical protein
MITGGRPAAKRRGCRLSAAVGRRRRGHDHFFKSMEASLAPDPSNLPSIMGVDLLVLCGPKLGFDLGDGSHVQLQGCAVARRTLADATH